MELIYLQALAGHFVDRLQTRRRVAGDAGQSVLEVVLIIGALAAIAILALGVIAVKVKNRTSGIDGGDTPPTTTYNF